MSCDCAHCVIGECSNFYVENGVRHCLRNLNMPTSFKAQTMYDTGNLSNPQLQMQQQITDILKTIDKLRGLSRMARLAKLQTLKSRVKLAEVKARKLALQERRDAMIQHAMETRRAELSLIHPWGWARDLGLNISDYSLEKAAKLKETVYHADRHPTYLDNPMRLALMRELVYG